MTFKETIQKDIFETFLAENEFAERRTIVYDGATYRDVLVVLEGPDEQERQAISAGSGISGGGRSDSAAGLYQVSVILHCAAADLGSEQLEQGQKIKISNPEDNKFFHTYYIAASHDEMGMLRVELEAIEE